MDERQDEKLDALLRSRRMENASPDLAERIVLRAQSLPQAQSLTLARRIRQMFAEFHLPHPAYALSAVLLLGFVVGLYTPVENTGDQFAAVSAQVYLDADEDLL